MACVAVVDDDPVFVDLMLDALRFIGMQALARYGSEGTFEAIRQTMPDLVILDIWLEKPESGWTVLEALRRDPQTRRIPVVLTSADSVQLAGRDELLADPEIRVLAKPFDLNELDLLVETLIPESASTAAPVTSITHSPAPRSAPLSSPSRPTERSKVLFRAPVSGWHVAGVSRRGGPGEVILTREKLVLTTPGGVVEHILISAIRSVAGGMLFKSHRVYLQTPRRSVEICCATTPHARDLKRLLELTRGS